MILNRRRFLSKFGLVVDMTNPSSMAATPGNSNNMGAVNPNNVSSLKVQISGLLHAVQYLKVPVIVCNIVTIIFEILLGGT